MHFRPLAGKGEGVRLLQFTYDVSFCLLMFLVPQSQRLFQFTLELRSVPFGCSGCVLCSSPLLLLSITNSRGQTCLTLGLLRQQKKKNAQTQETVCEHNNDLQAH